MRYIIVLLTILLGCTYCSAQTDVKISVGERGRQHELTQHGIKETISASVIKDDPKLHLVYKDDSYIIGQYDVAIVKNRKSVIGPFTVKEGKERDVFDKLYPHFEPGAQIIYDKIIVMSRNSPKAIAHPGITVALQ